MGRCPRTTQLEVHHKRRDGGNGIENAEVLCQYCHKQTSTYGSSGQSPPAFPEDVKKEALSRAGYQCQCTRTGHGH